VARRRVAKEAARRAAEEEARRQAEEEDARHAAELAIIEEEQRQYREEEERRLSAGLEKTRKAYDATEERRRRAKQARIARAEAEVRRRKEEEERARRIAKSEALVAGNLIWSRAEEEEVRKEKDYTPIDNSEKVGGNFRLPKNIRVRGPPKSDKKGKTTGPAEYFKLDFDKPDTDFVDVAATKVRETFY